MKSQPQLLEAPTEPSAVHGREHVSGLRKEQDSRNSKDACAGATSATLHMADAMQTLERFVQKATEESLRKTVMLIEQSLQGTNLDEMLSRFERPHWPRARHGRGSSRRPDDDGLERVDWVGSSFSRQESPGRADRFDRQVSPGRSLGRLGLGPPRESLARFSSKDRSSSNPGSQRTSLEGRRAAGTAGHRSRSNSSESSMNMGPIGTIGAT